MNKFSKIYIAGHKGLVGSAIHRKLISEGYDNIVFRDSKELDLRNQIEVDAFFESEKPEYVFLAAAKVGGVLALINYRGDSIYSNLAIQINVMHSAHKNGVKKLMFMGSNCLYPKLTTQPIKEEYILHGVLEPTTEYYAIAKIAGIKMCEAYRYQYGCNFISILPVNMYGENDNYNLETAHVMPALISKFHTAKTNNSPSVEIWGTGNARREFLHSDDLAEACLFLMLHYNESEPINIGSGKDISIKELALLIKEIVGYQGGLIFNASKPDGIPSKLLDVSKIRKFGWHHKIELKDGIAKVYKEKFLKVK
jgi:GDP-L-fucose synthase